MGVASQIGTSINYLRVISKHMEDMHQAKENLVMRAVHNIRTPATACSAFLRVISRGNSLKPQTHKLLDKVQIQIERIIELSSDLMFFLKPIQMRIEQVDLLFILKEVVRSDSGTPGSAPVKIDYQQGIPKIMADTKGLTWMFEELITNARKSDADIINIKACLDEDCVNISFEDNGCGVINGMSEKIFDPFYSKDNMSTGIGLASVKKIINEHQGKIFCDSSYKIGARFVIQLPTNL